LSFNGSGLFLINSTGQPVVADTLIEAATFNAFTADVGTGLSTCITKDGQTTITANLPMAGFRHTGVGNAAADTDYLAYGQAKTIIQNDTYTWCGTATGTADALVLTPIPAVTAYAAGQKFRFKSSASANTGAATVNISSVGAVAIQLNGAALAAGDIEASQWYEITFSDASTVQLVKVGVSDKVVPKGAITSSSLTMATSRILGRDTASTGAIEELTLSEVLDLVGSAADGDILYRASGAWTRLAKGTASQVLRMNSGATAPEWATGGITLATAQASTSGTSIDFTGLPSGIKRITVNFVSVSTNGADDPLVQIGDAGGFETSGYLGSANAKNYTAGFSDGQGGAGYSRHGSYVMTLVDAATNTWSCFVCVGRSDAAPTNTVGGFSKALSATLDRVRITTTGGTDAFDAGLINIAYEL